MGQALRRNRKGSDAEIIRLNSLGLSLQTISAILGCHPTSITLRLKSLNIPPTDTRRTFMEDILTSMPVEFKDCLADLLVTGPQSNIKDYVRELIVKDVQSHLKTTPSNTNTPLPQP